MNFFDNNVDEYELDNKNNDWFNSEMGQEVFKEYTTPRGWFCEDEKDIEEYLPGGKEWEAGNLRGTKDLLSMLRMFPNYKNPKIPFEFYVCFVISLQFKVLEFNEFFRLILLYYLMLASSTYILDEDDEPVKNNPPLSPKEAFSIEKNPFLAFCSSFDETLYREIREAEVDKGGRRLIYLSFEFIATSVLEYADERNNILEKNHWVFERETYINELTGTVRSEKSYLKNAISKASDSTFFENELNDL